MKIKDTEGVFSVDIIDSPSNTTMSDSGEHEDAPASRKSATSISKEDITKLFSGRDIAFISTISKDGSPAVMPVWIDVEIDNDAHDSIWGGVTILINSFEDSAKVRNVKKDPRVALAVVEQYNTYNMVSVKGRVIEITAEGADAHLHKLAKKYLEIGKYYYRQPKSKRVIIKIKPDKMIGLSNHPASLFLAYTP